MADTQDVKSSETPPPEVPAAVETKVTEPVGTPEWLLRKQIEGEIRLSLRQEYEQLFKMWQSTDLAELEKKNQQVINEGLQKLIDQYKESQKPPTHENLQQLLMQEYESFSVPIGHGSDNKIFTLVELPQTAERKFYGMFKQRLLSKAGELQALTQAGMDMPFETKLKSVMGLFDDTFDVLADAVVICLNPYDEDTSVTREWVQKTISSNRQWSIVEAQIGVNKLKDFFSRISQSGQSMTTMMSGVNFQQLQQLAR